jgi:hypothetical protein
MGQQKSGQAEYTVCPQASSPSPMIKIQFKVGIEKTKVNYRSK